MCFPKAPKVVQQVASTPEALPERQVAKAPEQAALTATAADRARRRVGYAALVKSNQGPSGLAPAVTTAKTLMGA